MVIPQKVKEAAQYLIEMYGDHLEYLGKYQGAEAFCYHFPDNITAGQPPVYLYENDSVEELSGDVADYFLRTSFIKDF